MGKIPITAFVVVAVLGMAVYFGLMSLAALKTYAEPGVRTMEKKPTDVQKAEPLADKKDGESAVPVDCGGGIWRLDVKNAADSQKVYEEALVKLSKDHPDELIVPMLTPVGTKGNTSSTSYYWRISKK